jgi:hypothetical protein
MNENVHPILISISHFLSLMISISVYFSSVHSPRDIITDNEMSETNHRSCLHMKLWWSGMNKNPEKGGIASGLEKVAETWLTLHQIILAILALI